MFKSQIVDSAGSLAAGPQGTGSYALRQIVDRAGDEGVADGRPMATDTDTPSPLRRARKTA